MCFSFRFGWEGGAKFRPFPRSPLGLAPFDKPPPAVRGVRAHLAHVGAASRPSRVGFRVPAKGGVVPPRVLWFFFSSAHRKGIAGGGRV